MLRYYDESDLAQARDFFQNAAAEMRRESSDTRHVARRRRARRAERFLRSGVRVTWSAGRRLRFAFSPTRFQQI